MLYILFRYLLWPLFMIIMRPQVYNLKGLRVKGGENGGKALCCFGICTLRRDQQGDLLR